MSNKLNIKEVEEITPIINKTPKRWKQSETNPTAVEVLEYTEFQNGWDYGEGGLIGKINEVIKVLNTLTKVEESTPTAEWEVEFDKKFSELVEVDDDIWKYGGTTSKRDERLFKLNVNEVKSFIREQIAKAKGEETVDILDKHLDLERKLQEFGVGFAPKEANYGYMNGIKTLDIFQELTIKQFLRDTIKGVLEEAKKVSWENDTFYDKDGRLAHEVRDFVKLFDLRKALLGEEKK